MADVLSAPVCKNVEYNPKTAGWSFANWNSCSVGVAYKARWGWERQRADRARRHIGFDDLVRECREARRKLRGEEQTDEDLEEEGIRTVASPGEGRGAYERSVGWWQALEERALMGE
jgi:xylulokinase